MPAPLDHITVEHGNLIVNVPRSLFKGEEAVPDDISVKTFRKMLSERYPWLSENALDVFMKNARKKMLNVIDEETGGRAKARILEKEGRIGEAIRHLEEHIWNDPDNSDTWYLLGEMLCRAGRTEEGYSAIAKGRKSLK